MTIEVYSDNCELILGLVAPVGVDLDRIYSLLKSYFDQFEYDVNLIHLSKVAAEFVEAECSDADEATRIDTGMDIGDQLRNRYQRGDFYSLLAINEVYKLREIDIDQPKPLKRHVHIVRSLKHPDEVETLRQVYGHGFFLLGISSSIESRKFHLKEEKGVPEEEIDRLIQRDDYEKDEFGQNTRAVFHMADAFVRSDATNISPQIGRLLDLLFSSPEVFPTCDEYAMFMAYAASLRSADLSRQVGAVITSENGDIIATGANDVPTFGGGLYWPSRDDKRDYALGYDSNEVEKNKILLNVMKKISSPDEEKTDEELIREGKQLFKNTGILGITEYGRAVHAEMEALSSAGRNGISTRNCILYTTTYPCHNCAKHIVAAGMKKVKYIEPYPKSYATILHGDAIDDRSSISRDSNKVVFEPFVGVGPRRFVDLFSMALSSGRKLKRKVNGLLVDWDRQGANLRVPLSPLSYIEAETILIEELASLATAEEGN